MATPNAEMNVLSVLTQLSIMLAFGLIARVAANKSGIPFPLILIIGGTMLASLSLLNLPSLGVLPELFRVIALIIVVFSSGFYLKFADIKKEYTTVLYLATVGVLITVLTITAVTTFFLELPLLVAVFLGAVLGGTDPAALASEMRKRPSKIQTIIMSEAIFNQPMTVILPLIILEYLTKEVHIPAWLAGTIFAGKFVMLVAVGFAVGLAGFYFGQRLFEYFKEGYEEIVGLMLALGVYVVAENVGGSGILAVGVMSILLNSSRRISKDVGFLIFKKFNREIAFIFTVFVFVMLGAQFSVKTLTELSISRAEIITIVFAIFLARFLSVNITTYKSDLTFSEKLKLSFISPKGLSPAAMAPLVLGKIETTQAFTVLKIVFLAIILSIAISLVVVSFTTPKEIRRAKVDAGKELKADL
jgi:cell volume regulation protein A